MKRMLLSILFLMFTSVYLMSQENNYTPPVYEDGKSFSYIEDFKYDAGGAIPEKSGNKWVIKDKGTAPKIIDVNLTHANLDESLNQGNALELTSANLRGLASSLFMEPSQMINGQIYLSFLLNVTEAKIANQSVENAPDYLEGGEKLDPIMQFNRIEDPVLGLKSGGNGQLYVKSVTPGSYKLGVTRFGLNKSTPNAVYADQELLCGVTYHLVIKIDYSTERSSETEMERKENIYLFIDPELGSEPTEVSAKQESVLINKTASAVNGIHFLQNALSPSAIVDGLRIANTWEGLGIAKPASSQFISGKENIRYVQNGNTIIISNLQQNEKLAVFDLSGKQIILRNNIQETEVLSNIASGVYVLRNGNKVLKFSVR